MRLKLSLYPPSVKSMAAHFVKMTDNNIDDENFSLSSFSIKKHPIFNQKALYRRTRRRRPPAL